AEEAGAAHDRGAHERRGDHRGEAGRHRLVHRGVEERELEAGADTGEEVEPGAGDLGPTLDVDRGEALGELEVVADLLEVTALPLGAQDDEVLLPALGDAGDDDVGQPHGDGLGLLRGRGGVPLGLLDALGELLRAGEDGGTLLRGGLADGAADLLLLRAQLLEGGERGAAALVGLERTVDQARVLAPGALARADDVGILTHGSEIDHGASLSGRRDARVGTSPAAPRCRTRGPVGSPPARRYCRHVRIRRALARTYWRVSRWSPDPTPPPPGGGGILIGAPHTSNWDFVLMLALAWHWGINVRWLGKNSLFKRPFGPLMRALGG